MTDQVLQLDRTARVPRVKATLSSVTVSNIVIAADIGVHAHELGQTQPLIVSVTLAIQPPRADRLEETIDYTLIVAMAEDLGRRRTGLIEVFAHRLATACLAFSGVLSADVTVDKPKALNNGLASTRIVLEVPSSVDGTCAANMNLV